MKWRTRLAFWLGLCAILGGFIWWQQRTPPPPPDTSHDPYGYVVEESGLAPVTPREISQGWDTRFRLKVRQLDAFKDSADMVTSLGSLELTALRLQPESASSQGAVSPNLASQATTTIRANGGKEVETDILLKLRQLPVSDKPLMLRFVAQRRVIVTVPQDRGPAKHRPLVLKGRTFTVRVRAAQEKVSLPATRTVAPCKTGSVRFAKVQVPGSRDILVWQTLVTIGLLPEEGIYNSHSVITVDDARLEDSHGRTYTRFYDLATKQKFVLQNLPEFSDREPECMVRFVIPLQVIARSAGELTLKARVSIDGSWPLELAVPVRKADGQPALPVNIQSHL